MRTFLFVSTMLFLGCASSKNALKINEPKCEWVEFGADKIVCHCSVLIDEAVIAIASVEGKCPKAYMRIIQKKANKGK